MPPQHGKSTLISQLYPIWLLGVDSLDKKHKNKPPRIGIWTYGQSLTDRIAYLARKFMESDYYRVIFPEIELTTQTTRQIITQSGAYIDYSSVSGAGTGKSYDVAIIDDAFKDYEEASNKNYCDKIYDWFSSVVMTRLAAENKVFVVGTRWSENDILGRVGDDYTKLIFPAIDEGKALNEKLHPLKQLEALREGYFSRGQQKIWSSLYMCSPIPQEGSVFKENWFSYASSSSYDKRIIIWDTACKTGKKNDSSVGIEFGYKDGIIYLLDLISVKQELPDLIETVKNWGESSTVYIEDAASGIGLLQTLRRDKPTRDFIEIDHKYTKVNKNIRIESVSPSFSSGRVKLVDRTKFGNLINEALTFPDGHHDDEIDCAAYGIKILQDGIGEVVAQSLSINTTISKSAYANLF
jgi:predicted phage terminase large subunit-like protein